MQLDENATQQAQEAMADLGLDGLDPGTQKIAMEQAAHLGEDSLAMFGDSKRRRNCGRALRPLRASQPRAFRKYSAELRPYQQQGFDFLCHQEHGAGRYSGG